MPARAVKPLKENGITTISELLNAEEEKLLEIKGIADTTLEKIYDAVQAFVEANQAEEAKEEAEAEPKESEETEIQPESINDTPEEASQSDPRKEESVEPETTKSPTEKLEEIES